MEYQLDMSMMFAMHGRASGGNFVQVARQSGGEPADNPGAQLAAGRLWGGEALQRSSCSFPPPVRGRHAVAGLCARNVAGQPGEPGGPLGPTRWRPEHGPSSKPPCPDRHRPRPRADPDYGYQPGFGDHRRRARHQAGPRHLAHGGDRRGCR